MTAAEIRGRRAALVVEINPDSGYHGGDRNERPHGPDAAAPV
jgi:hypothetical protein